MGMPTHMPTVLVIDDHPALGAALSLLLSLRQIHTLVATTPEQGLALLPQADLVIQDMNFSADTTSGMEGVALFHALRERQPDVPIILLTAWTQLEQAVSLVKDGAADYLAKPWDDSKLLATVANLLELGEGQRQLRQQRQARAQRWTAVRRQLALGSMVAQSDAMLALLELAAPVARSQLPVLITGPNGSGKDVLAQLVHAHSPRAAKPFVALNCGALPPDLLDAELFGAEAGAFTGAQRAREGRFEAAEGGTLFLDEIGNLSPAGQAKLLRVLESGEYQRLGSSRSRRADVRVISATNADLVLAQRNGQFREDLFYRLNGIELRVPPLADRADDIEPLAEHLLAGRASLSDAARQRLLRHSWPGNVRELRHALERAVLLAGGGVIEPQHLALPDAALNPDRNLDEPSREALAAALAEHGGNVSRVALRLGLSRQALYRRMAHHGLK